MGVRGFVKYGGKGGQRGREEGREERGRRERGEREEREERGEREEGGRMGGKKERGRKGGIREKGRGREREGLTLKWLATVGAGLLVVAPRL